MVTSSAGLGPDSGQRWQGPVAFVRVNYRPVLSSERATHTKISKFLNTISVERKKNWSRVPDGGLIPGQTGRLTVGSKISYFRVSTATGAVSYPTHSSLSSFLCARWLADRDGINLPARSSLLLTTLRLYCSEGRYRSFSSTEDCAVSPALRNTRKYEQLTQRNTDQGTRFHVPCCVTPYSLQVFLVSSQDYVDLNVLTA
jgi:hypothetical protein